MITDSFDNITEPVFTLKDFYGEKKKDARYLHHHFFH